MPSRFLKNASLLVVKDQFLAQKCLSHFDNWYTSKLRYFLPTAFLSHVLIVYLFASWKREE